MALSNILFICSRNQWRSRTAENIFKNHDGFNIRSAGTASSARVKVSEKLIEWADLICVMEKHHKQILTQRYSAILGGKELIVLDIPDEFDYMDEELIEMLNVAMHAFLI